MKARQAAAAGQDWRVRGARAFTVLLVLFGRCTPRWARHAADTNGQEGQGNVPGGLPHSTRGRDSI